MRKVFFKFTFFNVYRSIHISNTSKVRKVDLRSDTVTKPTLKMREVMSTALVGDDVMGDDPTVKYLESTVANLFQKEASLFFPTGTMSNLVATMCWCNNRGSEIILGDSSHIYVYEQGGSAQIAGISSKPLPNNEDGTIDIALIQESISPNDFHRTTTELIAIENTHNMTGGRCLPKNYMEKLSKMAVQNKLPIHMDGARIW
jgi:threonine aldolase